MKKALGIAMVLMGCVACGDDIQSDEVYFYPDVDPIVGDRTFSVESDSSSVSFQLWLDIDESGTYDVTAGDNSLLTLLPSDSQTLVDEVLYGPEVFDDTPVKISFDPEAVGQTSITLTLTDTRNNTDVYSIFVSIE